MKPGLSLRVAQQLALTPQLQQSIRLLQLSTLELSGEVEQMLADNPFLERDDEAGDAAAPTPASPFGAKPPSPSTLDSPGEATPGSSPASRAMPTRMKTMMATTLMMANQNSNSP